MTKQLGDLFKDFLSMTSEEQTDKIKQVRHTRTIERPKAAVKRQKKQTKKDDKSKTAIKALMASMTPEERLAFLDKLGQKAVKE